MPCGPYRDAALCREKVGPTSVRSSMRSRKRHIVKRVFSRCDANNKSAVPVKNIGPTMRTDGANQIRFVISRSATHTAFCPQAPRLPTNANCN